MMMMMMMNVVTLIANIEHSCQLQISKTLFTGKNRIM